MPTRFTMPTGAPLRNALTQTLIKENISARITSATTAPIMTRMVMRFIRSSDLNHDEAEIIESSHAQVRSTSRMPALAKGFVASSIDAHVAARRERGHGLRG